MKVKGPTFEIKEYAFSETSKDSTSEFNTRDELFDKYNDNKYFCINEYLKLYVDVMNI